MKNLKDSLNDMIEFYNMGDYLTRIFVFEFECLTQIFIVFRNIYSLCIIILLSIVLGGVGFAVAYWQIGSLYCE